MQWATLGRAALILQKVSRVLDLHAEDALLGLFTQEPFVFFVHSLEVFGLLFWLRGNSLRLVVH